jgi:hypothetical protein
MRYTRVLALALWFGLVSAPAAAQPDEAVRRPETTDRKERSEPTPQVEQSGRRRDEPAPSFTPSEKIGADQSVEFPADI